MTKYFTEIKAPMAYWETIAAEPEHDFKLLAKECIVCGGAVFIDFWGGSAGYCHCASINYVIKE